jgi:hypothetical protein
MKRIFTILVFSFITFTAFTQDLIVKPDGDSINCRINKILKKTIYFSYREGWDLYDTSLPINSIKSYITSFYDRSEVPYDWNRGTGGSKPLQLYLLGGSGFEIGRLPEDTPKDLINYYEDLKSGYFVSAGFTYFSEQSVGFGLKISSFITSNRIDSYAFRNSDGSHSYGVLSDRLAISFLGPCISTRKTYGNGNSIFTSAYVGYVNYLDNEVAIQPRTLKGETFGYGIEGGYEVSLGENFMLSFQASLFNGVLKKFQFTSGSYTKLVSLTKEDYESLFRMDLSAGIIIRL